MVNPFLVLSQVSWYLASGKVSNNQWNDVVGIIGGSSGNLGLDYLREWAETLRLTELLDQALSEAKLCRKSLEEI